MPFRSEPSLRDRFWDTLAEHRRLRDGYLSMRSWLGIPFQRAAIRCYLRGVANPRLHLGAGRNVLPGWLNTDYLGHFPDCLRLDVRKPFPFADASFEHIFSEHMIEHVAYDDGIHMLRECYRVLKPGGLLRVETPDLRKIVSVCQDRLDPEQLAYLRFHARVFKSRDACASPCVAINNALRHWGHRFVYDEDTLRHAFSVAGFGKIERVSTGLSQHSAFDGLRDREWLETNEFETLAMEGTKLVSARKGPRDAENREESGHA